MTRLQAAVNEALPRFDEIQNFIYWNATQKPGVVLTEGAFYAAGPVCLIAKLPDGSRKSTIKQRYEVRPFWKAEP